MKILSFLKKWSLFFKRIRKRSADDSTSAFYEESDIELGFQHEELEEPKETLLDKLKLLTFKISGFKDNLPTEYEDFKQRLESLKSRYDEESLQYELHKDKILTQSLHPEENLTLRNEVASIEIEINNFISTVVACDVIRKRLGSFSVNLQKLYRELIQDSSNKETLVNTAIRKLDEITRPNGESISIAVLKQEGLLREVYFSKYLAFKILLRYFGTINEEVFNEEVFADSDENEFVYQLSNDLEELKCKLSKLNISKDFQEMNKIFISLKNFKHTFKSESFWQSLFKLENMIQTAKQEIKRSAKMKIEENLSGLIKLICNGKITGEKEYILNSLSECLVYLKEVELPYENASLYIVSLILEQIPKKAKKSFDELYKLFCIFGACKPALKMLKNENSVFSVEFLKVHEILKDSYSHDTVSVNKKIFLKGNAQKESVYCRLFTLPDDKMLQDICQVLSSLNLDYKAEESLCECIIYINTVYLFDLKSIYSKLIT